MAIGELTTDGTDRHGRKTAERMDSRVMPRDVESRRKEGARMVRGMIGLRGEKKLRTNANLMSGSAVKTPKNGRTNPIGGKWA
jgi:hypothetical protein